MYRTVAEGVFDLGNVNRESSSHIPSPAYQVMEPINCGVVIVRQSFTNGFVAQQ
jgi:hypothetical protein